MVTAEARTPELGAATDTVEVRCVVLTSSSRVQEYGGDMPINGEAANEEIVLSD